MTFLKDVLREAPFGHTSLSLWITFNGILRKLYGILILTFPVNLIIYSEVNKQIEETLHLSEMIPFVF